jgi:hypothetical protein
LYVADISVPAQVYSRMGISIGDVFRTSDIIPVPPRETHGFRGDPGVGQP